MVKIWGTRLDWYPDTEHLSTTWVGRYVGLFPLTRHAKTSRGCCSGLPGPHDLATHDNNDGCSHCDYPAYHGSQAHCRRRIYCGATDRPTVVITTEAEYNTVTYITNVAESLAIRVCPVFGLAPDTVNCVEHHRERAHFGGQTQFDELLNLVSIDRSWNGCSHRSKWKPCSKLPSNN